jgi:hypothetical protein
MLELLGPQWHFAVQWPINEVFHASSKRSWNEGHCFLWYLFLTWPWCALIPIGPIISFYVWHNTIFMSAVFIKEKDIWTEDTVQKYDQDRRAGTLTKATNRISNTSFYQLESKVSYFRLSVLDWASSSPSISHTAPMRLDATNWIIPLPRWTAVEHNNNIAKSSIVRTVIYKLSSQPYSLDVSYVTPNTPVLIIGTCSGTYLLRRRFSKVCFDSESFIYSSYTDVFHCYFHRASESCMTHLNLLSTAQTPKPVFEPVTRTILQARLDEQLLVEALKCLWSKDYRLAILRD